MTSEIFIQVILSLFLLSYGTYLFFAMGRHLAQLPPAVLHSQPEHPASGLPVEQPQPEVSRGTEGAGVPVETVPAPMAPEPVDKPQVAAETPSVAPSLLWMERLQQGLQKTRTQLLGSLENLLTSEQVKKGREQAAEALFEVLIRADVGVRTTEFLVEKVRERLPKEEHTQVQLMKDILKEEILALLQSAAPHEEASQQHSTTPHIVMIVGVNGVGKTTTTGKLAFRAAQSGQKVCVGAADTYRAAAVEQLGVWAKRAQALFIKRQEGSDPASVAFEAVKKAHGQEAHLCLVDTAGRLHNREDLMQELAKVKRVMAKVIPEAPHEVLLVLDATTGQNAIQQAKKFREVVDITGLILTKLDGTAKGGVAVAIAGELKLPIRYIGVGEGIEDLQVFNPSEFSDALFA